ncbi:hypothetical protein [Leifsonia xyli]|uniref:hypothetical protein n=1 Tax=Leifsonia xyli TaxID=1575 RepID=UPI003D66F3CE
MSEYDLFNDINLEEPMESAPLPLGGVSKRAFTMLGTDPQTGRHRGWGKAVLARAGQPSAHGRAGWMRELQVDVTLDEISERTERFRVEHSVSVRLEGEVLTGTNYMPHEDFTKVMAAQGYRLATSSFGWDHNVLFERWERIE